MACFMKGVHCLTCFMKGVKFKYFSTLRWYSRVTEIGTKGLILGFRKQTQFFVSFTAPLWKRELSKIANLSVFKSFFLSILTCGHEPRAEMGFFRRDQGVTLRDKMHRFDKKKRARKWMNEYGHWNFLFKKLSLFFGQKRMLCSNN